MTNNPTIDGVSLKRDDKLFHRGNGRNCDRGWVEYICDEGCGDVRVRHRNGAVPVVKLSDLQWHAMTDEQLLDDFYSELSNGGKLSKRAICHIRDQQSTIARLEARITQLESESKFAAATYQAARDRIAELESGRGEPVAWMRVFPYGKPTTSETWLRDNWISEGSKPVIPLFTAPPAPVAVVHPFAEKVIRKLQRVQECAEDGQDTDIGRHWLDLLTQLGLLNRLQRSPARWEITQQGEDCLDATAALNAPKPTEWHDVAGDDEGVPL